MLPVEQVQTEYTLYGEEMRKKTQEIRRKGDMTGIKRVWPASRGQGWC